MKTIEVIAYALDGLRLRVRNLQDALPYVREDMREDYQDEISCVNRKIEFLSSKLHLTPISVLHSDFD